MKSLTHLLEFRADNLLSGLTKEELMPKLNYLLPRNSVWLRVAGKIPGQLLEAVCDYYGVHELTAEDISNTEHQPKYEVTDSYIFVVLKIVKNIDGQLEQRQLSIILTEEFILTFEEERLNLIDKYFNKIEQAKQKPSARKVAYILLDSIVDLYMDHVYIYQDKLDVIVDGIMESTDEYDLKALFQLKREVYSYRRIARPVVEITDKMVKNAPATTAHEQIFLRDIQDHAHRISTMTDNMCEITTNMQTDILTQLQYRLSKTMNMMTIAAFIFSPLMVITGIYGMNFKYMPELGMKYGYPAVLFVMLATVVVLVIFFRKKKYI